MKKTFKFDKLIRDLLLDKMENMGACVNLKSIANRTERISYYTKKLQEEASEVTCAQGLDELTEELADCLEVVYAIASEAGISAESLEIIRQAKKSEKGGFEQAIIVDTVTVDAGSSLENYYLRQSDKYPELTG